MSNWRLYMRLTVAAATLTGLVALSGGCGSSSDPSGPGTLSLQMVDAPDPTVDSIIVPIQEIDVHVNNDWQVVATNVGAVDLVQYLTSELALGSITLPAGQYSQLRLILDPGATITMTDSLGTHVLPLDVPSGQQTGIKVPVDFAVAPGSTTNIILDFNVADSVVALGNGGYHLKPVIHAAVRELTGTISGIVTNKGGNGIQRATVTATLPPPAGSTDAPQTFTTITEAGGAFKLWNLPPGTYSVVVSWASKSASANGVVVHAGQDTSVGTMALH